MWKDETHQREIHVPAGRYHEPRSMVGNCRYEEHADGLTQTVSQQVPKNMLTTLISKLTEPPHENVSINMITARSIQKELMDAQQDSTLGALGVHPSMVHINFETHHRFFQKKGCADRGGLLEKVGEAGDAGEVGEVGTVTSERVDK